MNLKNKFLFRFTVFSALFLFAFSQSSFSQNLRAENFGTVAAKKDSAEKKSPFHRARLVKTDENRDSRVNLILAPLFALERQTFALINQKRAEMNLPALEWSDEIAKIARRHSENMVKFNFFSHAGPDGAMVDDRADSFGISKWRAIGENIAYNRGFQNPVETAIEKWMLSAGHRENLLGNRWKETGIGIAVKADGAYYFTQVFITR